MIAVLSRGATPDKDIAKTMLAASPHRGEMFTVRSQGRCVLGISRKPDFEDETISSAASPLLAVFHGRLDNVEELAATLVSAGHPPASKTPADVAAAAFLAFGPTAPRMMRGVFAGAVTDGTQLWCFRDHIGFRPLFYRDSSSGFFAASEPKQIVAGAGIAREPNLEVLEQTFYNWLPSDSPSALQGVSRLPQNSVLVATEGKTSAPERYWHPENLLEGARWSPQEIAELFVELVDQAARRVLTGQDVVSLSGGIDSPAVAAFAGPAHLERTGRPLPALTAVFPDSPRVDERRYTELVANYLGLPLKTYELKASALDNVTEWARVMDGPVPVLSIPQVHEDCALLRQEGYSNLLTGEFAEFVFANHQHLLVHLLTHGRWRALGATIRAERKAGRGRRTLLRDTLLPLLPSWSRGRILGHRPGLPQHLPAWLDRQTVEEMAEPRRELSGRRGWLAHQLSGFDGSTVTMDADELCATLNGVTIRRPLADVDLWEFFLGLPAEVKFPSRQPKALVRRLLRGHLPAEILDRRDKTVFDDHVLRQIDYGVLAACIGSGDYRMPGVNYPALFQRIERRELNLIDWVWAKDLARIHAFLSLWA